VNSLRFQTATHTSKVNCAKITLNRCCRASHELSSDLLPTPLVVFVALTVVIKRSITK